MQTFSVYEMDPWELMIPQCHKFFEKSLHLVLFSVKHSVLMSYENPSDLSKSYLNETCYCPKDCGETIYFPEVSYITAESSQMRYSKPSPLTYAIMAKHLL